MIHVDNMLKLASSLAKLKYCGLSLSCLESSAPRHHRAGLSACMALPPDNKRASTNLIYHIDPGKDIQTQNKKSVVCEHAHTHPAPTSHAVHTRHANRMGTHAVNRR